MAAVINNIEYGWSDIRVHMLGNSKPLLGINEISWTSEGANEHHYGIGRKPVAFSRGAIKFSGSIKFHKGELANLRAALPAGMSLYDIDPFSIIVSYQAGTKVNTDILHGVLFTKDDQSNSKGATLLEGNLSFVFSEIENK